MMEAQKAGMLKMYSLEYQVTFMQQKIVVKGWNVFEIREPFQNFSAIKKR